MADTPLTQPSNNWCAWFVSHGEMWRKYHEEEWGIPCHDDRRLFEYLLMENMSCGLNWAMMMLKRDIFRKAFADFDFHKVAAFTNADIDRATNMDGMIHSRRKMAGIVNNAQRIIEVIDEFGSFDAYLWSFTKGQVKRYKRNVNGIVLTRSALSDKVAKDMKRRGFQYVGSVIIYSYLQAIGIINDHASGCPLCG